MRVIFMGTPDFAVPSLDRLLSSQHEVAAVVSQPDRPSGRGQQVHPTPVKTRALEAGIPVLQPGNIRTADFEQLLREFQPDVHAVAAYGKILPENILYLPRFGSINVHASLLPRYRGAAPIQWAIINGERKTGITIMQMEKGLDSGPIIDQQEIDILDDDDSLSLSNMLSIIGAEKLVQILDKIESTGQIDSTPQNHSQATLAPLIKKEDGHINWNSEAEAIICRIIALKPWPCGYALYKDEPYKIRKAISFYPEVASVYLNDDQDPGEVIALQADQGPIVRTRQSCICLTEIQPPNRKSMSGRDAINGGYIKLGMRFE